MTEELNLDAQPIAMLREFVVAMIQRDSPQLSVHQLAVYLTCYMVEPPHTVRGLASDLKVSKSVITRALDVLGDYDLALRVPDPKDRRSVNVVRTAQEQTLLNELGGRVVAAGKNGGWRIGQPTDTSPESE